MTTFSSSRLAQFAVSTDGVTYSTVGGAFDGTLNIETAEIRGTSYDSNGQEEYKPSFRSFTLDGSFHFAPSDAGQVIMRAAALSAGEYFVRWRMTVGSGNPEYIATAGFATSLPLEAPLDDTQRTSFSLRLSGVTAGTQA